MTYAQLQPLRVFSWLLTEQENAIVPEMAKGLHGEEERRDAFRRRCSCIIILIKRCRRQGLKKSLAHGVSETRVVSVSRFYVKAAKVQLEAALVVHLDLARHKSAEAAEVLSLLPISEPTRPY